MNSNCDELWLLEAFGDTNVDSENEKRDCCNVEEIHPDLRDLMENFRSDSFEYFNTMDSAYKLSMDDLDARQEMVLQETLQQSYFEDIFKKDLNMSFENFCCLLINCISGLCGECILRMKASGLSTESENETFIDRWQSVCCPHLVDNEWSGLLTLRSLGKQFWKEFLNSKIGQSLKLYIVTCESCDHFNIITGSSKKIYTSQSKNVFERRQRVANVCGMNKNSCFAQSLCYCGKIKVAR